MTGMKAFTFFAFCFVLGTFLSGIMGGQSAFATTRLSTDITAIAVVFPVVDSTDFMDIDEVYIGDELVRYTDKTDILLTGGVRALDDTDATTHVAGTLVKSANSNMLNSLLGYNVAATASTYGTTKAVVGAGVNLLKSIPRMIAWDYSYLDGQLTMIKYLILWPISAGFVFSLGMVFIGAIQSLFRR